jgi:hypothetical protein
VVGCVRYVRSTIGLQAIATILEFWSGRRESNPRMQLGKLPFYH